MLFPRVRYVVRETTERPLSATYRLKSGRAASEVEFVRWNEDGQLYARRVVIKDLLRKAQTEIEVVELQERAIADGLFALDDPTARRALETGTSRSR